MALAQLSIDLIAKTATFEKDLKRAADLGSQFASATVAGFTAIASGAASAVVAFDQLVKSAGNFQDLAEQIGSSAEGLASLAVSASVGGTSMDEVAAFATKLTKNLTGVDDESSKAGAALKALGLDIGELKDADPADQLERIAKALDGFQDGTGKTAVMEALAKGGAKLLPFLKELSAEGGRQVILTQQMIEQADAYSDAQARSRAKLGLYAQALATEAIPALTAFQNALTDTAKEMMGVRDGATTLKANDGVREFAKGAVGALGFVVDAADGVYRVVSIIGKSIGAIGAAGVAVATGEFRMAKSIMTELGRDVDATLNRGLFSDKLQKRLAEIGTQTAAVTGKNGVLKFDGASSGKDGSKSGKEKIDESATALAAYVRQLESATEKTLELTEVEKARIFLTTIGTTGEVAQVRELVLGMAARIDQEKEYIELLKLKRSASAAAGDAVNADNAWFQAAKDATPSAKLEKQRADMQRLAAGFTSGAFGDPASIEAMNAYSEAASTMLGNISDGVVKVEGDFDKLGATFASSLEDAIVKGEGLRSVIQGLGQDILRITVRKTVTEPIGNAVSGLFSGFSLSKLFGFAEGGVMTGAGPLPLRRYASGGVASSPQLAMYGEGSVPEAFVPLPDGRRIPVQMRGGGRGPRSGGQHLQRHRQRGLADRRGGRHENRARPDHWRAFARAAHGGGLRMSAITWPTGLVPSAASLRLSTVQRVHASPFGGSEQTVDLLNDRWLLSLTLSARAGFDKGAQIEAFIAALRGQTNYVALWHFARPSVRGTLASATAASAAQGASAVVLTGSGTLKAGDMLGISGLLLQVAADVTVGTSTSVSIVNRLRSAVSGTVTLTRPTANFRLTGSPAVSYVPGMSEPVSLDFAEVVA
jgi:hypothetical protein